MPIGEDLIAKLVIRAESPGRSICIKTAKRYEELAQAAAKEGHLSVDISNKNIYIPKGRMSELAIEMAKKYFKEDDYDIIEL